MPTSSLYYYDYYSFIYDKSDYPIINFTNILLQQGQSCSINLS